MKILFNVLLWLALFPILTSDAPQPAPVSAPAVTPVSSTELCRPIPDDCIHFELRKCTQYGKPAWCGFCVARKPRGEI